ncbi:glycosyltransferase [Culex quinquefasciatus]|uniref:Glycosyltransferase n=1 Tax=Culex quinquefasciatus TaxID=7176 RepID=B0WDD9_CULQU|nr:glycosyltransferase [Culex quinquefasciatus]|eukprot:XP_001846723.1 glycosyltransferase [Culex quinquefasciatus]
MALFCLRSGVWPFLLVISLCHLLLRFLDWFVPRKFIDLCPLDNPFWEGALAARQRSTNRQSLNDVRVHVHHHPSGSSSSFRKKRHKHPADY